MKLVKLSKQIKQNLRKNGCDQHIREFGSCFGVVIGPVNYGNSIGPEVDVRWQPSNLKYAYSFDDLVKYKGKIRGKRNKKKLFQK